jgi:hypothetical protein
MHPDPPAGDDIRDAIRRETWLSFFLLGYAVGTLIRWRMDDRRRLGLVHEELHRLEAVVVSHEHFGTKPGGQHWEPSAADREANAKAYLDIERQEASHHDH